MRLSSVLAKIGGGEAGTKTASAAPVATPVASAPTTSDAAREVLASAIKEAMTPEASTKTASASAPVEDLSKLAADVASAEHEAMTKEAMLYGACVADGFVARLAQYQEGAAKLAAQGVVPAPTAKVASAADDFEKFAAENPDLVREAHDLGYEQTKAALTKLAEAAWLKGHNATVEKIYKLACDTFVGGFADTVKLLEAGSR